MRGPGTGAHREVHLCLGQALHCGCDPFAGRPRGPASEVVVGGQGCRVERRDEHGFRRVVGVGDHAVGALPIIGHSPERAAAHDLLARRAAHVELRESSYCRSASGVTVTGESTCASPRLTAATVPPDGRSKQDALVALAEEQRRTRLHPVAGLHQQFGESHPRNRGATQRTRRPPALRLAARRRCPGD